MNTQKKTRLSLKEKLSELKVKTGVILRGYRTINEIAPGILIFALINSVFASLAPFVNIYMSGIILNGLAAKSDLSELLFYVLLLILVNLIIRLLTFVFNNLAGAKSELLYVLIENEMSRKMQQMDFSDIETPRLHELRERIYDYQNMMGGGLPNLYWNIDGFARSVFQTVFSVALVVTAFAAKPAFATGIMGFVASPFSIVLLLGLVLFNVFISMRVTAMGQKKEFSIFAEVMKTNRVFNTYQGIVSNYKFGKEIRLYNQKEIILEIGVNPTIEIIAKTIATVGNAQDKYAAIRELGGTLVNIAVYAIIALRALLSMYPIGSIVQLIGGLQQFTSGIEHIMRNVAKTFVNVEPLTLYFEFMDYESSMYKGSLSVEKRADNEYELEFHSVSFKYPGTEDYVLKNFSLKLHIGQKMAVVGMNGSGKTTMIKLLCRLYDPTDGVITLNGIDIKKYDYLEYCALFSVVFQDFKIFSLPLGQNIAAACEYDSERAMQCVEKAGFSERLSTMEKGLDTPLYKNFEENGIEVSGGEAQKIALARALYKNAPFVVLDEPTAALDPIAEFEIYSKFDGIVENKTAIYISHRLSSCRFCNDIAVFDKGELVQRGSHEKLLADETGKYHSLWNAQAQYYNVL